MPCTSGCRTQSHATYAECLKSKNIRIGEVDQTTQKKGDKALDAYAAARKEGIQPESTRAHHVERAVRISDQTGKAYQAV